MSTQRGAPRVLSVLEDRVNTIETDLVAAVSDAVAEARMLATLCARANADRRTTGGLQLTLHTTGDRSKAASRQVHRLVASR